MKRKKLKIFILVGICITVIASCQRDDVWKERRYRIAVDSTWYPLETYEKGQNLFAYTIDLLSQIATTEGIQVELFSVPSNALFVGLEQGTYDAVFSAQSPTAESNYILSDPYYLFGPVLLVTVASGITNVEHLDDKIIGVKSGMSLVFKIENFPTLSIKPYDLVQDALSDLDHGVVDGVILDHLTASVFVTGMYAGTFKIITAPLNDEGLRLIAKNSPHSEALIEAFNEGLRKMRENNQLSPLIKKWGLFPLQLSAAENKRKFNRYDIGRAVRTHAARYSKYLH